MVVVNGKMVAALPPEVVPYVIVKKDLLYRVTFLQGKKVEQLFVPRKHEQLVLKPAHTHLTFGRLYRCYTPSSHVAIRIVGMNTWCAIFFRAVDKSKCWSCSLPEVNGV